MRFCKKKYNEFLLLEILCFFTSSTAFSATTVVNDNPSFLTILTHGHLVLEIGGYQGIQGNAQHINIQDLAGDTFTVNNRHEYNAFVGAGYFVDGHDLGDFNMSYGVNAFYLAPTTVSGNVIQEDQFTNLSYYYKVSHYPVYLMAKSTINLNSPLALTLDVGIGPNFMRTYDFQENSLDGGITLPDNSIFSANITPTLSATIGTSLKINNALGQLPLELGYRFFYLGQGHFKTSNNQVLNELNTGKTYANALFLAISI